MPQSRAAARALDALPPATPGTPVHESDHLCQGLAFIRRASSVGPDLTQVRDRVVDIRRGVIGEGGAEREILIVVFHGRPAPFGLGFPTALPLVAIGRGELASHSVSHGKDGYETDGPFRTINLWWAGQEHRLSLDLLEQVPIATLWAMPTAIVHAAHAPTQPHEEAYGVGVAGDGAVPVTAPKAVSDILRRTLHASGREADPFAELRRSLKQRRSWRPLSGGGLFFSAGYGQLVPLHHLGRVGPVFAFGHLAWRLCYRMDNYYCGRAFYRVGTGPIAAGVGGKRRRNRIRTRPTARARRSRQFSWLACLEKPAGEYAAPNGCTHPAG